MAMSFMLYYQLLIVKYASLKGNTSSKRSKGGPSRRVHMSFTYYDFVDVLPTTAEQTELERIGLGGYFFLLIQ